MVTDMTKDTIWNTLCHLVSLPLKETLCHLVSCGGTKWHNDTRWYIYATYSVIDHLVSYHTSFMLFSSSGKYQQISSSRLCCPCNVLLECNLTGLVIISM